jgi:hypothetical protein
VLRVGAGILACEAPRQTEAASARQGALKLENSKRIFNSRLGLFEEAGILPLNALRLL